MSSSLLSRAPFSPVMNRAVLKSFSVETLVGLSEDFVSLPVIAI